MQYFLHIPHSKSGDLLLEFGGDVGLFRLLTVILLTAVLRGVAAGRGRGRVGGSALARLAAVLRAAAVLLSRAALRPCSLLAGLRLLTIAPTATLLRFTWIRDMQWTGQCCGLPIRVEMRGQTGAAPTACSTKY